MWGLTAPHITKDLLKPKTNKMKKVLLLTLAVATLLATGCNRSVKKAAMDKLGVVTEMSELGTVEYTIAKIIKASDTKFYTIGDRKILFTCRATMKAGIDMAEFSKKDVKIKGKEITITLPQPKVLAFNMPPEQAKLEYEKVGALRFDFTAEDRNELLRQGEEAILADAANLGILEDAKKNAQMFFEALLAQVGFEKINVQFVEPKEEEAK